MRYKKLPYLLIVPTVIWIGFIFVYPVAMTLGLGFFSLDLVQPLREAKFVGLSNFGILVTSPWFWKSVEVTLLYTIISVSGAFFLGLLMALLANVKFKGRTLVRILMIIPWTIPAVGFCMTWNWMLDYRFGIINHLLMEWNIVDAPVRWLFSPSPALAMVSLVTIWCISPLTMLVFLAGLQTISMELYDAAEIDGAGTPAKFRYITWPRLKPSRDLILILLTIWIFRWFVIIYLMTGGGPNRATETLVVKTYIEAFVFLRLGLASAIATTIVAILALVLYVYIRIIAKQKEGIL